MAAFLSHLAVVGKVAAATQNQALNALVFLYKALLGRPLQAIGGVVRAKKPPEAPGRFDARGGRGGAADPSRDPLAGGLPPLRLGSAEDGGGLVTG